MKRLILLAAAAASACSIRDRPEIRFHGPLTPAAASARCQPSTGTLVLRDDKVTFAPDEGTWVLAGTATTGTLQATRSRPTPDHRSYNTELKATWTESEVRGAYTTPFCTYQVTLAAY